MVVAMCWKDVLIHGAVTFRVPIELELVQKIGAGAYGSVASFTDTTTGTTCAVKKISNAFHDLNDGKRILREVKLLRNLRHENIITILDMYPPDHPDFEDIYIVTDLMESDLQRVINSKQKLADEHCQYFSYQILRALVYLHSAHVVHRDLKPANLLVNKNCDLKICDFGLARGIGGQAEEECGLTEYVVTRWYRAPEVVLFVSQYTKAIDVWSAGCVTCELIGRKPIFPGKDFRDQISKILAVLGLPAEESLDWLPATCSARTFLQRCPPYIKRPWKEVYPHTKATCLDVIEAMLTFHPLKRVTASAALRMPYYESLHLPEDEPVAVQPVDFSFDDFAPSKRLLQNYIYKECADFHPEIVKRDEELLPSRGINQVLEGRSRT